MAEFTDRKRPKKQRQKRQVDPETRERRRNGRKGFSIAIMLIALVLAFLVMFVGFNMFRTHVPKTRRKRPYSAKNFVKAFSMGLSNPAAIAVMLALFTFFKMDMSDVPHWIPVVSILALAFGSACYWYCVSRLVAHLGDRFNFKVLVIINRIAAIAIFIFGAILLYKGIVSL